LQRDERTIVELCGIISKGLEDKLFPRFKKKKIKLNLMGMDCREIRSDFTVKVALRTVLQTDILVR